MKLFVTSGTDIESYFASSRHIQFLYPELDLNLITEMVDRCVLETRPESIKKMRHAWLNRAAQTDASPLDTQIDAVYDSDPNRYVYGKGVVKRIIVSLRKEFKVPDPDLFRPSPYVNDPWLAQLLAND